VEDQSRPIPSNRRSRLKRSAQRRDRNGSKKQRSAGKPPQKRKPSHFPGAFFGFGPGPVSEEQEDIRKDPASKAQDAKTANA
jgi:hypothetical protein